MKSVLKVAGLFLSILLINLFYSCNKDKSTLPGPPTVKTLTVIEISYKSATSGGNVTSDGGPPIVSRGICWDTSFNPTVNNAWCRYICLLYTSDAADEEDSVDLGGRRIIKKKK